MNDILAVFIVQVICWVVLFILICYFVKRNAELKKEIESLKESVQKKKERVS